ncbi:MAG: GDP-mannose 4,6-dehydratase [Patescibacteria group bacterium]
MRILVTGGAGFIGAHLCKDLLTKGHEVVCLDNFVTGKKENLGDLLKQNNFSLIIHDVCEPLPPVLGKVDLVYHLAAIASPWKYLEQKLFTLKTNIWGTYHALEYCRANGSALIFSSTSEVYGDPEEHPQKEEYWGHVNPIGPRACYDEGKRAAESMITNYQETYGMQCAIARIFNTFGPQMALDDGRPVINFISKALRSEPLPIHGDGLQTRSFCYVSDIMKGLQALAEKGIGKGPINIGNPDERTILSIAELVRAKVNPHAAFTHIPRVENDPQRRCPDITKAKTLLGWEPKVSFEEGVDRTIEWVKELIKNQA